MHCVQKEEYGRNPVRKCVTCPLVIMEVSAFKAAMFQFQERDVLQSFFLTVVQYVCFCHCASPCVYIMRRSMLFDNRKRSL